jgi:hypothetical protein
VDVQPMEIFRGALASLTRDEVRQLVGILGKLQRWVRARLGDDAPRSEGSRRGAGDEGTADEG